MLVLLLNRFRQSKIGVFRQGEKEDKVNKKKKLCLCFGLVRVRVLRREIRFFFFDSTSRFSPNALGAQLDFLVHDVFFVVAMKATVRVSVI